MDKIVQIHFKMRELGIVKATISVDDENWEYIYIDEEEFQFFRDGDIPTNYVNIADGNIKNWVNYSLPQYKEHNHVR